MTFKVISFFLKKVKYHCQRILLANTQLKILLIKRTSTGDEQKSASRLQKDFNRVQKNMIFQRW
eukprot:UN03837